MWLYELTQYALLNPGLEDLATWQYARYNEFSCAYVRAIAAAADIEWEAPIPVVGLMIVSFIDGMGLGWLVDRNSTEARATLDAFIEACACWCEPRRATDRTRRLHIGDLVASEARLREATQLLFGRGLSGAGRPDWTDAPSLGPRLRWTTTTDLVLASMPWCHRQPALEPGLCLAQATVITPRLCVTSQSLEGRRSRRLPSSHGTAMHGWRHDDSDTS
jgi:hypothetical protein